MGVNKYNSEGYLDLTAYEAIQTVDKEIRDRAKAQISENIYLLALSR